MALLTWPGLGSPAHWIRGRATTGLSVLPIRWAEGPCQRVQEGMGLAVSCETPASKVSALPLWPCSWGRFLHGCLPSAAAPPRGDSAWPDSSKAPIRGLQGPTGLAQCSRKLPEDCGGRSFLLLVACPLGDPRMTLSEPRLQGRGGTWPSPGQGTQPEMPLGSVPGPRAPTADVTSPCWAHRGRRGCWFTPGSPRLMTHPLRTHLCP